MTLTMWSQPANTRIVLETSPCFAARAYSVEGPHKGDQRSQVS